MNVLWPHIIYLYCHCQELDKEIGVVYNQFNHMTFIFELEVH